ncbi:beta-N-acetylhexosaminidase [Dysgonomonas sp. BGC7]|uniref:beta-N-acetylhexosaminidase n=1 Tax=Dysgonomonas sp. BGC7 TaxID=1658008 RepID=UPI0006813904|nr:beta-N-acetylhexosaminidase [Dysgonomonas sp. BGC7]MBD8390474.1 beta-N-acetylhexosaminidase [Dysgonomonas sp. BGC7]
MRKINYKIIALITSVITLFFGGKLYGQSAEISIIPKPQSITVGQGEYHIDETTEIFCPLESFEIADLIAEVLRKSTGYKLPVKTVKNPASQRRGIVFALRKVSKAENKEAYQLTVSSQRVLISAPFQEGLLYGGQTLRQLLPPLIERDRKVDYLSAVVPSVNIVDQPRFSWRGYMQDVSRTFFGVEVMKKYIDVMSLYKLNVLHLHLTDDQGWRIEIKKYPELTSEKTTVFPAEYNQPAERSGFYTQQQIKELVAYAALRNITIVPEIDVPGHSWPVLIVYPHLGVNRKVYPDYVFPFLASWGIWGNQFTPNTLDPTKEDVYTFLDDVFSELAPLFPGQYFHFGGDEVRHTVWENEPHIKEFMQKNNMSTVIDLQSYFVTRVSQIVKQKGKTPIGWNDVLKDESLPKETAIMAWLRGKAVKESASKGHRVVATPTGYLYFDITQESRHDGTTSDLAYGNINSLERIYLYDPTQGLEPHEEKFVLGLQANMWTAIPQEVKDMNVQNFPRLMAVSEIGWISKGEKDFDEFSKRIESTKLRLDELKIDYYRPGGYIAGTWTPAEISSKYKILEWDVTNKVYANGRITAGLFHTEGESFLNIKKVQLLENGKVISEDTHRGFADNFRGTNKTKTYLYSLKVDSYNANSKYTVKAEISGYNGTNTYGNFTFSLSPYQPFIVTEPR